MGPSIWLKNCNEIVDILEMDEWNNDKFRGLLSPNIWKCHYEDIKKILNMEEWKEDKFKNMLTSNIWKNSYKTIKTKLSLPYWNENKYLHLLNSSLFTLNTSNIVYGIELFEQYNIGEYVTNKALRKNLIELRNLLEYMKVNNINLIVKKKNNKLILNPIISDYKTKL